MLQNYLMVDSLDLTKACFSLNVVVQPSVPWMDLNEKIKDTGLFFPIDPGPSVSIGPGILLLDNLSNTPL